MRENRVDSRGEHENALQQVDVPSGRMEGYHTIVARGSNIVNGLVREPVPAYMPTGRLPHDEVMRWVEGFLVGLDGPLGETRPDGVPRVGGESRIVSQ